MRVYERRVRNRSIITGRGGTHLVALAQHCDLCILPRGHRVMRTMQSAMRAKICDAMGTSEASEKIGGRARGGGTGGRRGEGNGRRDDRSENVYTSVTVSARRPWMTHARINARPRRRTSSSLPARLRRHNYYRKGVPRCTAKRDWQSGEGDVPRK